MIDLSPELFDTFTTLGRFSPLVGLGLGTGYGAYRLRRLRRDGRRIPNPKRGVTLGKVGRRPIGLDQRDAEMHCHVLGATGSGKSTALARHILARLSAGVAGVLVDPFGDLCDDVLARVPEDKADRVCVVDPLDRAWAVGVNILAGDPELAAEHLVSLAQRLFGGSAWGPQLEDTLRMVTLTLARVDGTTLLDVPRMLTDDAFRGAVLTAALPPVARRHARDRVLSDFWSEWDGLNDSDRQKRIGPLGYKLRTILMPLAPIVGQVAPKADPLDLIDRGGLILVRAPKGLLGDAPVKVLGALVIERLWARILARASMPAKARRPVVLYLDEAQEFTSHGILAPMLAEARKYRLAIVIAHQYLRQLPEDMRASVHANARTKLVFTASPEDVTVMARHLQPLTAEELAVLPRWTAAGRVMHRGHPLPGMLVATEALPPAIDGRSAVVRAESRSRFARPVEDVEHELRDGARDGRVFAACSRGTRRLAEASLGEAPQAGRSQASGAPGGAIGGAGGGRAEGEADQGDEGVWRAIERRLSPQMLDALRLIRQGTEAEPVPRAAVVPVLDASSGSVSRALKRLEEADLITRHLLRPREGARSPHGFTLTPTGVRFVRWLSKGVK